MASKARPARPKTPQKVVFQEFTAQLEEAGITTLQEIELSDTESVWIRLGSTVDTDDNDEFAARLEACEGPLDLARVILDYHPEITAEEQLETYQKYGTPEQLAVLFTSLSGEQAERLGKVKVRRSAGRRK